MSDKPMTLSQRAARKVITEIYANPAPESDVSEIADIIARETGCDPHPDLCCCGKCAAEDAAVRDQAFVAEVMAGCDIQRGGTLYRQVPVVVGPGKTQDQIDLESHRDIVQRLVDALNQFKHADGCFCEAAFAPSGCHVRHSDECEAAMKALSDAAALRRAGGND